MMNAQADMLYPIQTLGFRAWTLLHGTEEWKEGFEAARKKVTPDYRRFKSY